MKSMLQDESIQVLLFICIPMIIAATLFLRKLFARGPTVAAFPGFSVKIVSAGLGFNVVHESHGKEVAFPAEMEMGSKLSTFVVRLEVPATLSAEDLHRIVPELELGLTRLKYEYVIFRMSPAIPILEGEKNAAILELRELGIEVQSTDGRVIQYSLQKSAILQMRQEPNLDDKVQSLLQTAKGIRQSIEVLARSKSGAGRG